MFHDEPLTRNDENKDLCECTGCGIRLPRADFYRKEDGSLRYSKCRRCRRAEQKKRDANRGSVSAESALSKANLSDDEFKRVVAAFKVLAKVRDRIRSET